jgi:O-antigen/teichoic acid export membrane protein
MVSFIYKGGSILASFLLVPLTITFLDTENYGLWLTLSSFIAWFSFFDIGLGNGLRNKFAEAKANGDLTLARAYVSSAYFTIGSVCLLLTLIFFVINFFVDWTRVFNANAGLQKELGILMPIVFSFFCLQLVVKLITTIYTADQHHSMQGKVNFYTSVLSLLAIWLMTHVAKSSLLIFGTIFSALPVLLLLGLNVFAFSKTYKKYKPTLSLWKKEYLKDIFGLGISFFFIQLAWIIITTTDNMIISQLFSPAQVVPYNLAFKLFSISSMIFTIIVAPYWSTFTEAYFKKDYDWIKKSMKNLKRFVIVFCLFSFVLLLISNLLFELWVGKKVEISFGLSFLRCIYTCLIIYLTPLNYFINGVGKIKLQLYQTIIMGILNIPISIFLAKYCGLGVLGVLLGTILCVIPGAFLSAIQFNKIINQRAFGLWGK